MGGRLRSDRVLRLKFTTLLVGLCVLSALIVPVYILSLRDGFIAYKRGRRLSEVDYVIFIGDAEKSYFPGEILDDILVLSGRERVSMSFGRGLHSGIFYTEIDRGDFLDFICKGLLEYNIAMEYHPPDKFSFKVEGTADLKGVFVRVAVIDGDSNVLKYESLEIAVLESQGDKVRLVLYFMIENVVAPIVYTGDKLCRSRKLRL